MAGMESVVNCTRITAAVVAVGSGILCIKGIMMTAAAVSVASVIGGIFLTLFFGAICIPAAGLSLGMKMMFSSSPRSRF